MRKILDQKFWSHGTPLGCPGWLLAKTLPSGFPHYGFLVTQACVNHPVVVTFMGDFFIVADNSRPLCVVTCDRYKHKICFKWQQKNIFNKILFHK